MYEFVSGKNAASWLKKHPGEIDLLFLDVEMKEPNGMETARYIRTFDEEILIVFVTGHKDYVFDGYEADALDYVLKPAEPERLKRILERVRRIMEKNREKTFIFKNMDGAYRLPFGLMASYRFIETGYVRPYIGAKLGAMYARNTTYVNSTGWYDNPWGFYVSPEIGLNIYPMPDKRFGFHVAGYYSYATNDSQLLIGTLDGQQSVGFRVGVTF